MQTPAASWRARRAIGAVGSQLGVAIVPEGVLNDGTEDLAQLVLLIRPAGAEGGYSAAKAIQTPLSGLFRKSFEKGFGFFRHGGGFGMVCLCPGAPGSAYCYNADTLAPPLIRELCRVHGEDRLRWGWGQTSQRPRKSCARVAGQVVRALSGERKNESPVAAKVIHRQGAHPLAELAGPIAEANALEQPSM